jgi:hypothetical protein
VATSRSNDLLENRVDRNAEASGRLLSGATWDDFCERWKAAGRLLDAFENWPG